MSVLHCCIAHTYSSLFKTRGTSILHADTPQTDHVTVICLRLAVEKLPAYIYSVYICMRVSCIYNMDQLTIIQYNNLNFMTKLF